MKAKEIATNAAKYIGKDVYEIVQESPWLQTWDELDTKKIA